MLSTAKNVGSGLSDKGFNTLIRRARRSFTVRDGAFLNPEGGEAVVYEVRPKTAFGFGKGEPYSQTRWRF